MNIILDGRRALLASINQTVCEICPFGYKLQNENVVHCIGHLNINLSKDIFISKLKHQNITINLDYSCQVNVSQNKVVSLSELAKYFTIVTGIKFTEIKRKLKKRQR